MKTFTLIITTDENTCDKLEASLGTYEIIQDVSQNTGFWYSNGETGPEWFTVDITASEEDMKEVEKIVEEEFKKLGKSPGNMFWQ